MPSIDPRLVLLALGAVGIVALGWWLLRPSGSSEPAGALEEVTVAADVITVRGYAYDPDNDADTPVTLRITIDGAEAADLEPRITENKVLVRELDPAPNRVDNFEIAVGQLAEGEHEVCVLAVDEDHSTPLGCARAYVRRSLLEDGMVIAHYGAPGIPALGIAGEGTPEEAAARVVTQGEGWLNQNRVIIPAFDMITSIATSAPGEDGTYSNKLPISEVLPYLDAIRAVGGIMIIDLQTGNQDFLDVAKRYEELLLEPDVHLALDPEWRVPPGVAPGSIVGSVEIEEINRVGEWLAALVEENQLPEKIFVVHQFRLDMVKDRDQIVDRPQLTEVFHIDGFGPVDLKVNVYNEVSVSDPLINGLKLFFDEDEVLLESADVRNLFFPFPLVITYQ